MATAVEYVDDRFAGIDIDSLLNGERRPLTYERKRALFEAPEFIQRLNGEETVMEGQSLCIECKIRGFPVPAVRWFKDDEEIEDSPRIHIETNGLGGYFLVIDYVTRGDEAAYRCRAENVEGACSSFLFLSVKGKPKRKDPFYCPSWRAVSYPPMFSTIVEKVEEEEKQGREFETLPPSPLTGFYYALTLKSRCSWPTFLGDWAFVNNVHPYRRHNEKFESSDEDYIENDDDDDFIDDKFGILNGDICDKLNQKLSNKGYMKTKRGLRKRDKVTREKIKKQRIDVGVERKSEQGKKDYTIDEVEENKLEEVNMKQVEELNNNNAVTNCAADDVGQKEIEDREKIKEGEYQTTRKQEVVEDVEEVSFHQKSCDVDEVTNEYKIVDNKKEDIERKDEEENDNESNGTYIVKVNMESNIENEDERNREEEEEEERNREEERNEIDMRINKEELQESLSTAEACKMKFVERNEDAEKEILNESEIKENKLRFQSEEDNRKGIKLVEDKTEVCSKKTVCETDEESLRWRSQTKDKSDLKDCNDSRLELNDTTKPIPEDVLIFKSNPDILYLNHKQGLSRPIEAKYGYNERDQMIYNEPKNENDNQEKMIDRIVDEKRDNNNMLNNRNYEKTTTIQTTVNNTTLRRQYQRRDYLVNKKEDCQNRLEQLRLEDERRLEELKQQELRRIEELKEEEKIASCRLFRRNRTPREDVRFREQKQIAELRRREQLQIEELRQKEEKQREELKRKEEKQKEEMKCQKGIMSGKLTLHEEDALKQQINELRLNETKQMEELKCKEYEHKEELNLQEFIQKKELIAYEQNQIDEFKLKGRRMVTESWNGEQTKYCVLQKQDKNTWNKHSPDVRLQYKKEQLIKEQLKRQYEEELQKRQARKEEEATQFRQERTLSVKNDKYISNNYRNCDYMFDSLHQTSKSIKRSENISIIDYKQLTNITNNRYSSTNISTKTNSPISSLKTDQETVFKLQNDRGLLEMKSLNSTPTLGEPCTNSLDRGIPRFSEYIQKGEYQSQNSFGIDKYQRCLQSGKVDSDYRRSETQREKTEGEITNLSLKKENSTFSNVEKIKQSNSIAPSHLLNSCSFASFFEMESKQGSNPALRTHEELLKLAESIAAKRETFTDLLSQSAHADNMESFSEKSPKSLFSRQDKAEINIDKPVNKSNDQRFEEAQTSRNIPNTEDSNRATSYRVLNSLKQRYDISSSATMNSLIDNVATVDSSAIEIRPFVYNSSRTIARRFYKKE